MSQAVGIDLGTTISLVAWASDDGRVSFATARDGSPRLRSIVYVDQGGETTVGDAALRMGTLEPGSVFSIFKRSMGSDWSVEAAGRTWTPEDLSAVVLRALADDCATAGQARPARAVVTIPAYFGDDARRATRRAGELADLEVVGLLHEPTAACLTAAPASTEPRSVLVFDLGGGTFDISVVRFSQGDPEVIATRGDHRLGGKDWDDTLVDLVSERLEADLGDDPRDDPAVLADLQERAREAKHALSRFEKTALTIPVAGGVHRVEVSRAEFNDRSESLFHRTEDVLEQVLEDIGGRQLLDDVLLVGGSTRMPPCAKIVERITGLRPRGGIDPDQAVAAGAALAAAQLSGPGDGLVRGAGGQALRRFKDVTAHALGFVVVAAGGDRYVNEVMIPRNAPIPAAASKRHVLEVPKGGTGTLDVYMLQGESERPLDTQPLGLWRFNEIASQRRGEVEIEVSYTYDEDGIVQVSAAAGGDALPPPEVDRTARDLRWTEEDPTSHRTADVQVALVIDLSGSMEGESLAEAKKACIGFVEELDATGAGDRIALIGFGSSAFCAAAVGDSAEAVKDAARGLSIAGSTNMAAGVAKAGEELAGPAGNRVLVLLTDGYPDSRESTMTQRDRLVREGFEIVARGVEGADSAFLSELSTGDGALLDLSELSGSFRGIARQLGRSGSMRRFQATSVVDGLKGAARG